MLKSRGLKDDAGAFDVLGNSGGGEVSIAMGEALLTRLKYHNPKPKRRTAETAETSRGGPANMVLAIELLSIVHRCSR